MKKIIYSLLFITATVGVSCDEDLPKANFDLYELKSVTATGGDMSALLSWEADERAHPKEYLILWTSESVESDEGRKIIEGKETSVTIDNLVNDAPYTFSVQPSYSNGLASKKKVVCTPKNLRYPITGLTVSAGDQKVRLKWTKPASQKNTRYQITVTPESKSFDLDDPSLEEYMITGLTNGQEYTFGVTCIYPTGSSETKQASGMPGAVSPIILSKKELVIFESCTFTYNDMFFVKDKIKEVSWDFGDGSHSVEPKAIHAYMTPKDYTVTVKVTYKDNTTESGSQRIVVATYKWDSLPLHFGGLTGYVKVSNPVFSPDGTVMYIPTSTPSGHLFAVDVASGEFKWAFPITKVTYGGGPLVSQNGLIYQCAETTDISNVYAINPDGTERWSAKLDDKIGASPALSANGVIYCLTNKPTLYALDGATGAIQWKQSLEGSVGSAVAIDKDGNIYAGTNSAIHAFSPSHRQIWILEKIHVTERGSFALHGETLYATQKNKAGLVAVNIADGSVKWTYPTSGGDSYFPVTDKNGMIYFTEKGSQTVHAVHRDGSKKWMKKVGHNLNYSGSALSEDGILYIGTQSGNKVLGLNTTDGDVVYEASVGQQVMSSVVIGPDRRLYHGTIGTNNIGSLRAYSIGKLPEKNSWSMRGGNLQGTNRQK